jgi:hypothetical protein
MFFELFLPWRSDRWPKRQERCRMFKRAIQRDRSEKPRRIR